MKKIIPGFVVVVGVLLFDTSVHAVGTSWVGPESLETSVMMVLSTGVAALIAWRRKKRFE